MDLHMFPQFEKMIEFEPEKLSRDLLKVQLVVAALVTGCPGYLVIYTGTHSMPSPSAPHPIRVQSCV